MTFTNRGTNAIYLPFPGNHGAAGVDGQTLEMFEKDLARNLAYPVDADTHHD